jgi:hypothetical protein
MESKKQILVLNQLVHVLMKNQNEWSDLKIDKNENVIFIDLNINTISLTIEINSKTIDFSFEDGWSYFGGNPNDKSFFTPVQAVKYLNTILNQKLVKDFNVKYHGKNHLAHIQFLSADPNRQMGTENLYRIYIFDDKKKEEVQIAELSEYPVGNFTIYHKHPKVELTNNTIKKYLNLQEE